MHRRRGESTFAASAKIGWEAALLEIEHQAEHWDTPNHGETGHLIAQALHAAVEIARTGGLRCEHRGGSANAPAAVFEFVQDSFEAPGHAEPIADPPSPPSAT